MVNNCLAANNSAKYCIVLPSLTAAITNVFYEEKSEQMPAAFSESSIFVITTPRYNQFSEKPTFVDLIAYGSK